MRKYLSIVICFVLFNPAMAEVKIESGGHKYEWSKSIISIDRITIYETRTEKSFKVEGEGCSGGESLEVLSVVGNIISFRVIGQSSCPGSAYPNYWNDIKVMRLEDGRPSYVNLNDLFPMDSIIYALSDDKWIINKYGNNPKSYLRSKMNPRTPYQCGEISPAALRSFSFHHIKNGKVAVRVHLPRCLHSASTIVLGIYLDTNTRLENLLKVSSKNSLLENKIEMHNKSLNSTLKSSAN